MLNRSLGPFIRKEILRQIEVMKAKADLVIVDIPLLYETGYESLLDQVAVVYLPESIQLQRLMKRDHLTSIEAQQRINSQMPIEEKRKRADILFDNQGTIEEVKTQVQEWLAKRKQLRQRHRHKGAPFISEKLTVDALFCRLLETEVMKGYLGKRLWLSLSLFLFHFC